MQPKKLPQIRSQSKKLRLGSSFTVAQDILKKEIYQIR